VSDRSSPRTSPSAVILCETTDAPALWAAAELQSLGVRCDIILAPLLGASVRFEHALDANGRGEISIDLPDGRRLSSGEPVSIGTFVPDSNGRFSMAAPTLPRLQQPVAGVLVTLERVGGNGAPTGRVMLSRPQPAAAIPTSGNGTP